MLCSSGWSPPWIGPGSGWFRYGGWNYYQGNNPGACPGSSQAAGWQAIGWDQNGRFIYRTPWGGAGFWSGAGFGWCASLFFFSLSLFFSLSATRSLPLAPCHTLPATRSLLPLAPCCHSLPVATQRTRAHSRPTLATATALAVAH